MATVKSTRKADITADIFQSTLTLTFSNGESLSLNTETLGAEIAKQAMLHGLKQKLVDAAAISRNTDTGRSATIDDKYDAVKEVFDRLTSDNPTWNKVREAGAVAGNGLFVRALMQMTGKTKAQIDVFLEKKTKEEKAALRKNPKVAVIMAELSSANDDIDTDDLLSELGIEDEADETGDTDTPTDAPADVVVDTAPATSAKRSKKSSATAA